MHTVNFQPIGKRVEVEAGTTLLDAAQRAGVGLSAICGGVGSCETCRVYILQGKVSEPSYIEEAVLTWEELAGGLRLACQTEVLDDVRVNVPPTRSQRRSAPRSRARRSTCRLSRRSWRTPSSLSRPRRKTCAVTGPACATRSRRRAFRGR
ncbi:MAG: 2Fe-2S iron-sulfur cluster-binding protein [Anaerolineae bacterium]|nr:2Fe-2S iron-sulfur cluster-binding protein [Anaerolineae bacterium]